MNSVPHARKSLALLIGVLMLVAPRPAHAIFGAADIVIDFVNYVINGLQWVSTEFSAVANNSLAEKEYIFDGLARYAAVSAVNSLSQSMTNWAASGFQGSPAFVTDLRANMLQLSDSVANDFARELRTSSIINSPYQSRIAQQVLDNYLRGSGSGVFFNQNPYTLKDQCPNDEAFLAGQPGSFNLSCYMSAWTNPANNPIGAQLLAESELSRRVASAENTRTAELNWGQGFLSWRSCGDDASSASDGDATNLTQTDSTANCTIETPGSVVAHTINKFSVDVGADIQVNADEISEVIGNLFSDLLTNAIQGKGGLANANRYVRPTPPPPSAATVTALLNSFATKRSGLTQFVAAWNDIRAMAVQAKSKLMTCQSSGASDAIQNDVDPLIARADAAVNRATDANAKLDAFETRIKNAQAGQEDFQAVLADYQTFQDSGIVPSSEEVLYIVQQDTLPGPDATETTLLSRMKAYTQSCPVANGTGNE